MSDPAIKLFGKTIVLPCATEEGGGGGGGDDSKGSPNKETTAETKQESPSLEERTEPAICGAADAREKPPSSDDQETTVPGMDSNAEKEEKGDPGNPQEKTVMKKPDKILPCPRCNSMDTKFCYYNNYNVNQPRHFCKNCQRYWTAGGTMRNVPVGAGRRKNKNYSSAYLYHHHLSMSAEAATLSDQLIHRRNHHPALNPNGTVVSFGPDTPLCESMASVLNLAEQTAKNCVRNGFSQREDQVGEERTTVSSLIVSNSNPPHPLHQVPYMNASPWPYPWNPPPPPPPPGSAFCTPTFPIPFYPAAAAYWGCSGPWSIPWPSPPLPSSPAPAPAPATTTTTTSGSSVSGPNSPTLGKHSRNGEVLFRNSNNSSDSDKGETGNQEKCLWIPKTLRIDDPEEASKSSFWTTLGFKNEKPDAPSSQSGLFRRFQIKDEFSSHKAEDSPALHANPAALSRSINFHESL